VKETRETEDAKYIVKAKKERKKEMKNNKSSFTNQENKTKE